ncbi:hypothetical protein [Arachnia propionica]|uniref:hypothetical protein n=1 Tax=Arachnia propionica TaxID=1750 RepID=UPI003C6FF3E1
MGSGNAGGGGGGGDGRPRFSWPFFLAALGVGAVLVGMVLALSQAPGTGEEAASGCSATPDVVTPSTGSTQWQQEWSFDAGEGKWGSEPSQINPNLWEAYAHGDCLVVISGWKPGEKARLTGYRIAEDGPQRLWSIEEEHLHRPSSIDDNVWWGGKLVLGSKLLDPTTGALSDGPWSGVPAAFSNDFALVCDLSLRTVCSGWDWNGGAPTKRWTQEYDGMLSVLAHKGLAGNTDKGAVLAELSTDPSAKKAPIVAVSLADGSLLAEWPAAASNQEDRYIEADDGWIHVAPESAEASAVSLTGERTSFPLTGSNAVLLVAEKGKPTIEQFRAAYETGDVSWARVVIDCPSRRQCSFNGNPSPLDLAHSLGGNAWDRARFQHVWSLSSDGRTLFMRPRGPGISGTVDLVDIPSGKEIPLINYVGDRRPVTPIVREDLVIAIEGSSLVGYRPR